jgi:hypothetical protein
MNWFLNFDISESYSLERVKLYVPELTFKNRAILLNNYNIAVDFSPYC